MGLGGVAIATLPSVIFPKLMFSDRLGGGKSFFGWAEKPAGGYHKAYEPDFGGA